MNTVVKKLDRRKTIKTYGNSKSSRQDVFNKSSSQFDAMKEDERLDSPSNISGKKPNEKTVWDLPATIRDDFAQHDPVSMFPDGSSTIPDNTMTQKRLMDDALLAENSLAVPNPELQAPSGSSASSIPWSAYLTTQGVSAHLYTHRTFNSPVATDKESNTCKVSAERRRSTSHRCKPRIENKVEGRAVAH